MHPVLLKFGPLTVYSYGVMVAVGFGLATALIYRNAAKSNLDKNEMLDLLIIILIAGVIGARLFYVLLNLGYYASRPLEIPNLSMGGLVWFGGFLAALAAAVLYLKRTGLDFWTVADFVAPYLAIGQAVGRIGCFLNGCCYGTGRHPTQLYSAVLLLAIFAVLRTWQARRHFEGEIFLAYCLLYSVKRFCIEFLRGDNPKVLSGLTLFQVISVVLFSATLVIFFIKARSWKKRSSHSR